MKYVLPIVVIVTTLISPSLNAKNTGHTVAEALLMASRSNRVPLKLITAICTVESHLDPQAINEDDGGSPSHGLCQIKLATARTVGFKGKVRNLYDPYVNAYYAAKYLRYKFVKNHSNWIKAVSAYNGGPTITSNVDYVNKVFLTAIK